MTATRQCPSCGTELPADAPNGVCVPCLLRLGLPDQPAIASTEPKRFGDYELLNEIARGGMGVVYKARHVSLKRMVALKLILAGQFASTAERARFQFEAQSAAQLEHPNIVPIYEVGEHEGRPFFTIKLIEGGSLGDRIERSRRRKEADALPSKVESENRKAEFQTPPSHGGGYTATEAASLVAKIARAVHFAHQHGIIHRDLKPSNILLDESGEPYVTDFGLAKGMTMDGHLTITNAVLGSPYYMSPEQAAGKTRSVSTATDIYSLGVMLYELLTGKLPLKAETSLATLKLITEAEPLKPRALNPAIDRDLETICLKCLEKDPTRRYASADAMATDLDSWRENKPISARRTNLPERAWKWVKREPLKAALAVAITLAIAGPLAVMAYYILSLLPRQSAMNPIVAADHHYGYTLEIAKFKDQRCTQNFDRKLFTGERPAWQLFFEDVPDEWLPRLRVQIFADQAGRPDPPRTSVLTNGQIFQLRVESFLDRAFYCAQVGFVATNLLSVAPQAKLHIVLVTGQSEVSFPPSKPLHTAP